MLLSHLSIKINDEKKISENNVKRPIEGMCYIVLVFIKAQKMGK